MLGSSFVVVIVTGVDDSVICIINVECIGKVEFSFILFIYFYLFVFLS